MVIAFFFRNEGNEPDHIHVESGDGYCKFWLNPTTLAYSTGYNSSELNKISKLVDANKQKIGTSWNEHFSENKLVKAIDLEFTEDSMKVFLEDGREISVPIEWFPKLRDTLSKEKNDWRFIGNGVGIHWESLDEDISVKGLLS